MFDEPTLTRTPKEAASETGCEICLTLARELARAEKELERNGAELIRKVLEGHTEACHSD